MVAIGAAVPAHAQLGAGVSLESDYRLRGYSLTAGHPALNLDASYDDPSGLYADVNATARLDRGPELVAAQGVLGYAHRVAPQLSLDLGVSHLELTRYSSRGRKTGYTEFYVGLAGRRFAARTYYSPDYYRSGRATLYTEIEAAAQPATNWRLNGHVGRLTYLGAASGYYAPRDQYDWRATLARDLGRVELHVALSGGGPSPDYYRGARRSRTALVVGGRASF